MYPLFLLSPLSPLLLLLTPLRVRFIFYYYTFYYYTFYYYTFNHVFYRFRAVILEVCPVYHLQLIFYSNNDFHKKLGGPLILDK